MEWGAAKLITFAAAPEPYRVLGIKQSLPTKRQVILFSNLWIKSVMGGKNQDYREQLDGEPRFEKNYYIHNFIFNFMDNW